MLAGGCFLTLPVLSHQIPNDFLWVAGAGFVLSCGEARSQCSHSLAFPTSAPTVNMGIACFSFHGLFPEQRHSRVCAQEVFPSQSWWHPCLGKRKAFLGRSCASPAARMEQGGAHGASPGCGCPSREDPLVHLHLPYVQELLGGGLWVLLEALPSFARLK